MMNVSPKPRLFVPEFAPIVEAWSLTEDLHSWCPGASDQQISDAERVLERRLPPALKALYQMSNGCELLMGNLQVVPLQPSAEDESGLTNYSDDLRQCKWLIPDELVVFGGNGSDELFGTWLPRAGNEESSAPVIQVGEIFEPACMAVAGTTLCQFLRVWSAYYIMSYEDAEHPALDVLGVPQELRTSDPDMPTLFAWGDPLLPDTDPDPYARGLDANGLRSLWGGMK